MALPTSYGKLWVFVCKKDINEMLMAGVTSLNCQTMNRRLLKVKCLEEPEESLVMQVGCFSINI